MIAFIELINLPLFIFSYYFLIVKFFFKIQLQVGLTYGRKMMTGFLKQKHNLDTLGEKKLENLLPEFVLITTKGDKTILPVKSIFYLIMVIILDKNSF